jgi:hypothetical protein
MGYNMKNEKLIILIIGILIGLLSNIARLSTFGFFYTIGIFSTLFFGIIHIIFLREIYKYFDSLKLSYKIIAWMGILIYPIIFLFQFDVEEYKDAFYVYEFLTGKQTVDFEYYAFYIAIISGIIYIMNFIIWKLKIKSLK